MIGQMETVFPYAYWHDQDPLHHPGHNVAGWFKQNQQITVPSRDLGWHLAQGWIQVGAPVDDPNNPPEKIYTLTKDVLDSTAVLADLISDYTTAFNEGREANDQRYDDLVVMYNDTLLKTHRHLNRAAAANNAYETLFLTSLSTIISQTDYYLNAMKVGAIDTFDRAGVALNEFAATLAKLGTGYDAYAAAVATVLTDQQSALDQFTGRTTALLATLATDYTTLAASIADLETEADTDSEAFIAEFGTKLDELETNADEAETTLLGLIDEAEAAYLEYRTAGLAVLTDMEGELTALEAAIETQLDALDAAVASHGTTYQGIVDLFSSDWTTHAATTRALLVDLGTTELARINEQFDNQKIRNRQMLMSRGLYKSALTPIIDAQVERERAMAIGDLNDRLAREKVAHEHQLYGERTNVRDRQAQGEQYLFSLQDMAIKYRAQWSEKLYQQMAALKDTTLRVRDSLRGAHAQFLSQETAIRERVFGWGQDAVKTIADGMGRIYQVRDALTRMKTDSDFKLADLQRVLRALQLDTYQQDLTATDGMNKFIVTARESILNKLNGFIAAYADGVSKYASQTLDAGKFLASVRQAAIADHLKTRFQYCAGLNDANAAQVKMYQYQLDTRNNLAVALFGFMERRTDEYPDINRMGELAMGLGDAGATQVIQP